jgi:tRNA threonylcarbamoyl adenosine modification protein YjeE
LARAAILAALGKEVAVPSPTFTLIQEYDAAQGRIVHSDLYRLSDPSEIEELGLPEAFEAAAVMVEWPERLAGDVPADRLEVHLSMAGEGREARLVSTGPRGAAMLAAAMRSRDDLIGDFVKRVGWGAAAIAPLAGDASNRRYLRLSRKGEPAVLMDAPVEKGEDVRPFAAITDALRARNLSAPAVLARDAGNGLLLLEDLGDALYARRCADDPALERPLYEAAVDVLAGLRADGEDVPPYDAAVLEREAALLTDWWVPAAGGDVSADLRAEYLGLMAEATAEVEADRSALVLRDYHAENLLWLPDRQGDARVGLLDYQDALLGHPAYDLVSLLEDARRDLSPGLAEAMIDRFVAARPDLNETEFRAGYDVLGAQRNAKIVGIFARLCRRDGKPHYIDMIPRVWSHLMRDLSAPHLSALREFVEKHVPTPTRETLARAKG